MSCVLRVLIIENPENLVAINVKGFKEKYVCYLHIHIFRYLHFYFIFIARMLEGCRDLGLVSESLPRLVISGTDGSDPRRLLS